MNLNRTLWAIALLLQACAAPGQSDYHGSISGAAAVVVTTDYRTGSWAVVSLDHAKVEKGFGIIHQDTICRYSPITKKMYLVQRMGADAVAVMDPMNGYAIESEFSVGQATNAQDIAVVSTDRAYVPRYSSKSLLVLDPATGENIEELDLSPWADSDGMAEPGWALANEGKVFVAIQRLKDFQPTGYSSMLVFDGTTGKVIKEIKLVGTDPFSKLRYCAPLDSIVIGEIGKLSVLDGGVELLHTSDLTSSGFIITEKELGGDIIDVVIARHHKGYAIVSHSRDDFSASTSVVSFDPDTGKMLSTLAQSEAFDHSFLELTPSGEQLWVAQRKRTDPGVRVFDTQTDEELTSDPIDVGLAPFMICFANLDD